MGPKGTEEPRPRSVRRIPFYWASLGPFARYDLLWTSADTLFYSIPQEV